MSANQWVNRYVSEVGRLLPSSKRSDVEMEIRSLLQDELEALPAVDADSEEATLAVLRKFGSPTSIAARYGAAQHLIGPALYPSFLTVLRIVLVTVFAVALFGMIIGVAVDKARFAGLENLGAMFGTLLQAGATVVIVFAIMERVYRARQGSPENEWDPRTLPTVDDANRIKWGEMIAEIAISTVGILLLNFFVDRIGSYWSNGEWHSFPLFSAEFLTFVPFMTVLWGLDVLVKVFVMVRGRWENSSRGFDVVLNGLTIALLVQMLRAGQLAAFAPVEPAFKISVAIALVVVSVEFVRLAWLILSGGRAPRLPGANLSTPQRGA